MHLQARNTTAEEIGAADSLEAWYTRLTYKSDKSVWKLMSMMERPWQLPRSAGFEG